MTDIIIRAILFASTSVVWVNTEEEMSNAHSIDTGEDDGCVFCERCCHRIPETEFEAHKTAGCTPFEVSLAQHFAKNLTICAHGCGKTIPEINLFYHSEYGCSVAEAIGR